MEDLRKLLDVECSYRMKSETMDEFLGLVTEQIELKEGQPLITYGRFDDNVYILRSGIMRFMYFDGTKEITFGFSSPGTVIISYYPFYRREASFFQVEACCEAVVMKIPKSKITELIGQSIDFAQWMLWISMAQLWLNEKKLAVVNGEAKERFESLIKNRPEILEKVSAKIIASYIGVTPQYLSKLKRLYMPEYRKNVRKLT
jgi:CRP-like cAMP-binding protein